MNVSVQRSLQPLKIRYADPMLRKARSFWSWWTGELIGFLPDSARRALTERRQNLYVEAGDDMALLSVGTAATEREVLCLPMPANDAAAKSDIPRNVQNTILVMPDRAVLSRRVSLPLAAEENLREVLGFEMDLHTPFTADEVHFDFTIVGRDPQRKRITVDLVYAPKTEVEALVEQGRESGLDFDIVTCRRPGESTHQPVNLLPRERRRARQLNIRSLNLVLTALMAVLLATAIAIPLVKKDLAIADAEARLEQAAVEAREGSTMRRDLEKLAAASQFLIDKKQDAILVVQLIDEVSRLLPDHTWVARLDVAQTEVQVQGQSEASSELIALLESSPYFENARFRSPVVKINGTARDRFHISADVTAGAEQ